MDQDWTASAVPQKVEESEEVSVEESGQGRGLGLGQTQSSNVTGSSDVSGGGATSVGIAIVRRVSSCSQSSSFAASLGLTSTMSDDYANDEGRMEKAPVPACLSGSAAADNDGTTAAAAAAASVTSSMSIVAEAVSRGSSSSSITTDMPKKIIPQQGESSIDQKQQQQQENTQSTTTNTSSNCPTQSKKTPVEGLTSSSEIQTSSQDAVVSSEESPASFSKPSMSSTASPRQQSDSSPCGHTDDRRITSVKPDPSQKKIPGDGGDENDQRDTQKCSSRPVSLHDASGVEPQQPPPQLDKDKEDGGRNEDKVASFAVASVTDDHSLASIKVVQNSCSRETSASSSPATTAVARLNKEDEIPWTVQQHRDFVAAIYDVGLEKCSPSIILENMYRPAKRITRERAKSHLQKYRLTKGKGKREFLKEYDSFLDRTETIKDIHTKINKAKGKSPPVPAAVLSTALKGQAPETLIGGDAAALLSFSVLHNINVDQKPDGIAYDATPESFPTLSKREKKSSLGRSLIQVHDMLQNMTNILLKARHGIVDVFPEGEGYESPSSSEDEVEEEEDDEDDEEEKDKVDTQSSNLIDRKPSLSSLSSASALRNHRQPAALGPAVNTVKKSPPPGKSRVAQYRPPSQPTRPSASHPPPPPGHPAYASHHHQYYGGGPPPPPGQGYSPYLPPHPYYGPPPGMYGPGPPPMPHPHPMPPPPHPSYSMPPPPYPPPDAILNGTGTHTAKPDESQVESVKSHKTNTAEPEPTKHRDGGGSHVKPPSETSLQPRTSPEPENVSQREKPSPRSDGRDTGRSASSKFLPDETEEKLGVNKVHPPSLSPTPVTTHSRKRSLKSVFDPPPHRKTSPVHSKRMFDSESYDDDRRGKKQKRSRPSENPNPEVSLVSTLVGLESHLLDAGSPYHVDTDELGSSPIKFQRRPNSPSFATSVTADDVFPDHPTTTTIRDHHPAEQYHSTINQSPSELSMASRESFSEHILNQTASWEYSAAVDKNTNDHRQHDRNNGSSYRHGGTENHHEGHRYSESHDQHGQQYEVKTSTSTSLYQQRPEYLEVDRSSPSAVASHHHRHDSMTKNKKRSQASNGHLRSGGNSSSLSEFSRKFFD